MAVAILPIAEVVELAIFALILALILLRRAWVSTFGRLLLDLAEPFDHANISFHVLGHRVGIGFGWVATLLRGVNNNALALLGRLILANQWAAHKVWQGTAYVIHSTGRVIGDLAEAVYRELRYLWRESIPAYVSARLHPIASKLEWLIHYVEHLAAHPTTIVRPVTRILDPRIRVLERDVARLEKAVRASGAAVLAPPVAVPVDHAGAILHGIDALRHKVGRLARSLAPAAVAGAVASALVALRLGWLKCGNVQRAAKHVCGMDGDLLSNLLAGTLAVVGTVSLVEFATEMQGLVADVEAPVRKFWRA